MAEPRLLVVRLSSLGDIVHTLPAVAALREAFPGARVDWVVESKWVPVVRGNPDASEIVALDRASFAAIRACLRRLRAAAYDCVLDFQGLYKSAVLARLSGAPRRIGWDAQHAREGGAALLYTERVRPRAAHIVEQNLELAAAAGAKRGAARFPLVVPGEAEEAVERLLAARTLREFFVLSPGGGWRAKCWPPERYGELHRRLAARFGFAGVVNCGPGEEALAEEVVRAAGQPAPLVVSVPLEQLMALLRRAKVFVGGDTGPMHLAAALGTPVVALFGPTDPKRNGPYSQADIVVSNARPEEITYRRGDEYAPSMLSITVDEVMDAVERRLESAK